MSRRGMRYTLPYVYPYRTYRSAKYSNETVCFNTQVTAPVNGGGSFPNGNPPGVLIVPATDVLGNRKCKNFTIKVTANLNDDPIIGALIYVPEGTIANPLQVAGTAQSLYEPNQNIIATFVIPPNCTRDGQDHLVEVSAPTQITVSNKLARNLNTGDYIVLLFATPNGLSAGDGLNQDPPITISGTVNYAIKY